jgi:hypothetical protein
MFEPARKKYKAVGGTIRTTDEERFGNRSLAGAPLPLLRVEEARTIEAICARILPQDDRPQSRDVPDSFLKRPLFCHPTVTSPDDSESASGRVRGSERASLTEDRTT